MQVMKHKVYLRDDGMYGVMGTGPNRFLVEKFYSNQGEYYAQHISRLVPTKIFDIPAVLDLYFGQLGQKVTIDYHYHYK